MDLLEVPFDALAFRLYALPADAAVAYLALFAAAAVALGLWSIRGAAVSYKPNAAAAFSISYSPPQDEKPKFDLAPLPAAFHPSGPSPSSGTHKSRFAAYYSAEAGSFENDREDSIDRNFDETDRRSRGAPSPWSGDWSLEWTAVKRAGHLGWHSYQDLTELNGNVVKLWDARPTPAAMLLRRRL